MNQEFLEDLEKRLVQRINKNKNNKNNKNNNVRNYILLLSSIIIFIFIYFISTYSI